MGIQLRLVTAAKNLERRIFASLPRGFRLVTAFMRIATDAVSAAFGLTIYSEFLRAGIHGMPDVGGKPASEIDVHSPRLVNKLPHGYGAQFGERAAKMLYALGYKTPDVHDILNDYLLKMLQGHEIKGGHSVHEAEKFVMVGLQRFALNRKKKEKTRSKYHGDGGTMDDEGHYTPIDPADPHAFQKMDKDMTGEQLHKLMEFLKKIHPDLPAYFQLASEGVPDKQIIMDKMLPGLSHRFTGDLAWKAFNNWKMKNVMPAVERFLRMGDH